MPEISAIILAAGSGRRIGTPKLKLKIGEEYYVNLIIKKLISAGIKDIVCITKKEDSKWFKQNAIPVQHIINENPELGMINSVQLGINQFKDSLGAIIFPVDHPLVNTETIMELVNLFKKNNKAIIKPNYNNFSGHPIIIPNVLFNLIKENKSAKDLKFLISESNLPTLILRVKDSGIIKNINTQKDLANIQI